MIYEKNKFRERFIDLLKESNLSQKAIAKELGITPAQLSHFKSGYNEPNINTLMAISDYFCVTIDYLVGKQDW